MDKIDVLDPKIITALIASSVSLIIAILNSIWQYRNNKKINRINFLNTQNIEILKTELANRKEFLSKELEGKVEALHNSSRAIQLLKDDLRKIKMSVEDSLDLEQIFDDVKESTENLTNIYADKHMYLSQIDLGLKEQIHRAKNIALTIQSDFNHEIKSYKKTKKISPTFIKLIIDRRNELNEIDIRLIEKKAELSYSNRIKF